MVFVQVLKIDESLKSDGGIFGSLATHVEYGKGVEGMEGLPNEHHSVLWHKVQHALKRILSFQDVVEIFAITARDWPQLFRNPVVKFLESSPSMAYGIKSLGSFESECFLRSLDLDISTTERAYSRPGLGDQLKNCIRGNRNGRRRIHAEVQLWIYIQSLETKFVPFRPGRPHTGELSASHRIVIGVSKLTCRLCHWFFQTLGPHTVAIRSSSLNVYDRWALPSLAADFDIPRVLYYNLAHEISRVLAGGEVQRTETDTDSAPNSAGISVAPGESSYASSDFENSGFWSHVGMSTSSIESDSGRWKAGCE